MSSYTVINGDTFEDISRKQFGTVDKTSSIIAANPGASDQPTPGTILVIPKTSIPRPPTGVVDSITTLVIDGLEFIGWGVIEFTRSMDSFGSFNFNSVWEPDNRSFRDVYRPFKYQSVAVFEGRELLFNGTTLEVTPSETSSERIVQAAGYSLPGVINDCNAPISALPLERDVQDLQQIATALLDPFGLTLEFDGDPGPTFDREAIEPTDKIYNYLIKLAKQRKLIITDTPEGACKFHTEVTPGKPVAIFNDGDPAILAITPQFNSQDYYSHVTGQSATFFSSADADAGGVYTVVNSRLSGVLRPFTFQPDDTLVGDTKTAVEAKAGRMFAGAVSYLITIPSWRDPNGKLWTPNTTIKIRKPSAMIYNLYEFLIRKVAYRRTSTEEIATLTLVLPGVFSGKIPDSLPWDG